MPRIFTESERENLKNELLLKGFDLLREKGYKGMTIDDLGVSKGLFYNIFPSKEEFTIQVLTKQNQIFYDIIAKHMTGQTGIFDSIMHIMTNKNHQLLFLRLAEQQELAKTLSPEKLSQFCQEQRNFYREIVILFGKDPEICLPEVVGNLITLLTTTINSIESLPFLFKEKMNDTIFYQAHMLYHYIDTH